MTHGGENKENENTNNSKNKESLHKELAVNSITVKFDSIETFAKIESRIRFQIILSHNDRIIYIFEK